VAERVLVVEDNPVNALVVETILTRVGDFAVVSTCDGEEVLRLVAEGNLDAVVMDVSLAGTTVGGAKVDGLELTRRIRAVPGGRHLPVILLTAYAMRGDRERLLFASGANDYVAKPIVDQRAFLEVVRQQIRSAGELRPASRPSTGGSA
jgi:CheY-like chemotaxis protein